MTEKYRTELKSGGGVLSSIVPRTETVIDNETNKVVGEVTRWDWQKAGDLIAEGEWQPTEGDD